VGIIVMGVDVAFLLLRFVHVMLFPILSCCACKTGWRQILTFTSKWL